MTDEEILQAVRAGARHGHLPPPATPQAVAEAERIIGFPLPPLLRRLYLEAANGGFGPGEGILGVRGGAPQGHFADLADLPREGPDPTGQVPAGLVLLYDWGCAIWSLADFRDPAAPIWAIDNGELFPEHLTLADWLGKALDGTLRMPHAPASPHDSAAGQPPSHP